MRQVTINLYKFSELDSRAQQVAIENYRQSSCLDDRWWDDIYTWCFDSCAALGLTMEERNTFFEGFGHQGQGVGLTAYGDTWEMYSKLEALEELNPSLLKALTRRPEIDFHVAKLLDNGTVSLSVSATPGWRGTSTQVEANEDGPFLDVYRHPRIIQQLTLLHDWSKDVMLDIAHWLFVTLESEYEYLLSDEYIAGLLADLDQDYDSTGSTF